MNSDLSIGRYFPTNSLLHRIDARMKLISSILIMVVLFVISALPVMLVTAVLSLLLIRLSRVPLREILRSMKPIWIILVFALVFNLFTGSGEPLVRIHTLTITREGIETALFMGLRLSLLIMNTALLLTLTTTPTKVADALESLMKPLERVRFPVHEMAMMMSIAMRFVPTLLDETNKIMKAQSSRGADYDTGGLIRKARGLVSILIPLFLSAFRRADELAIAMESRCYRGGEGRSKYRKASLTARDWQFLGSVLLICAGLLTGNFLL